MPERDPRMDAEIRPLIIFGEKNLGKWIPFSVLDDAQFMRTVRWFVNSKNSPFGWSPEGRPQTASRSADVQWKTPNCGWSREIHSQGVYKEGLREGRFKLRMKRSKQ